MSDVKEFRDLRAGTGLAVRDAGPDATTPPRFVGHAAVTNQRTKIGDPASWGFFEEVAVGVFAQALGGDCDARFLIDHSSSMLVSRQSAGDLRLAEDAVGLGVDSDLDLELSYVRDLRRNVEARRITGMSFGFFVKADQWTQVDLEMTDDKGETYTKKADLRTILELELIEVSAVTFPAYPQTDAALRALRSNPDGVARRQDLLAEKASVTRVSRHKVARALDLMGEIRAGRMLSAGNLALLQSVLEQLAAVDAGIDAAEDTLDGAMQDLSGLLGVANPDPDDENDDGQDAAEGGSRSALRVPTAEEMRALGLRFGERTR